MFLLYNLVLTILAPIWAPVMWLRARARSEQPNWKERMGNMPIPRLKSKRRIWIHAVSVGEVIAAIPILRELHLNLSEHEVVLSVTTSSGHQTAREQARDLVDYLVYFPIDVARFQLSAMQKIRPDVLAVMETELWFNLLWAAKVFDVRTMLINGRISDRSYRRSLPFRFFFRAMLSNVDRCLMQSQGDAERIENLGAKSVEVLGNTKFDQALLGMEADPEAWRKELRLNPELPTVVIGSTRGQEEENFVLQALDGLQQVNIVHAPRHLERVSELLDSAKSRFPSVALRSNGGEARYLILDTYGELDKVYSVADLVVIGGGFAALGGQNLVQPLAHGKPVLHGPYMSNFRQITAMADEQGAAIECRTPEELRLAVEDLLAHPEKRASMGSAAKQLVMHNLGASHRYAEAIAEEARRSAGRAARPAKP